MKRRSTSANRGFSLIELVIVVTIMVVLTSLLAPQLLRYVERSREAKDAQIMAEVQRAFNLALVTVAGNISGSGNLWYTKEGQIINVNQDLAKAISAILGGSCRANGTYWMVDGLAPLTSKKYTTNTCPADTRVPVGGQAFRFVKTNTDNTVQYLNDPSK